MPTKISSKVCNLHLVGWCIDLVEFLKRTIGVDDAYTMTWKALIKLMTKRFQELTQLCTKMVPEEEDKDAIRVAKNLMDQKLKGYAIKNVENKRRFDISLRDNQQQPFKRQNVSGQNVARAYTVRNNVERKGNKTRNNKAIARAYAIGGGGAGPDSNVVTGTFLLNNRYATMLFDSGADRSFVSTTFSTLLDVIRSTLDNSYAVELAVKSLNKNLCYFSKVRISQKSQEYSQNQANTDTRFRRVQKEAKEAKPQPKP
ncbi:putative reverse transcriptase domain-containing protein [Tanacetum coccineum]